MTLEQFMERSSWRRQISVLRSKLETARTRGFSKTQIELDTLQELLDRSDNV